MAMPHLHPTRHWVQAVDKIDTSNSVGPNSSPDVLLPHYEDILDDIPFLHLNTDGILDDEGNDPSYQPAHHNCSKQMPDEEKAFNT